MAALATDLPRQREWVDAMRAETDARLGHTEPEDDTLWSGRRTNPWRAIVLALLLWWLRHSWG